MATAEAHALHDARAPVVTLQPVATRCAVAEARPEECVFLFGVGVGVVRDETAARLANRVLRVSLVLVVLQIVIAAVAAGAGTQTWRPRDASRADRGDASGEIRVRTELGVLTSLQPQHRFRLPGHHRLPNRGHLHGCADAGLQLGTSGVRRPWR